MRPFVVPAIALSALVAGCDAGEGGVRITTSRSSDEGGGVLRVVDTLQCPQTQGVLTRKGSAQDGGAVCTYTGPRGAEVTLHLAALNGAAPASVLKSYEDRLSADLPHTLTTLRASAEAEGEPSANESQASEGDTVHVQAPGMNIQAQGEKAAVRLPGLNIETDGDKANIRIGGLTIRADDRSSRVNIDSTEKTVSIQAANDASRVSTLAPGQATRASFILVDSRPSLQGWRVVGYEARGPVGGPLVIATVRGKDRNEDQVFRAAKALVALNVGE